MRILYLTNGFPFPLTSGYLRHYFLMRELAKHHAITLLAVVGPSFEPEHAAAMEPFTERVITFRSHGRGRSPAGKMIHWAQGRLLKNSAVHGMRRTIERLLSEESFDVVLFSGKETYPAIEGLNTPPVIADFTDASSMRIRGQMQVALRSKLPVLWVKYRKMRRYERLLLARAAHGLFASVRDRDVLVGGPKPNMTVIPNGVDFEFWTRNSEQLGLNTLIFTGAMNYAPNADAAMHLIRDILPLVEAVIPEVQVLIVGHSPKPALVAEGKRPNVTVTGYVDDVRPYLEQATLFVAPLRFGAGIQNKLLDAMAMQVPVVATSLAAAGLRTENGQMPPLRIADAPDAMAEIICEELQARAADRQPDAGARAYVKAHFDWGVSGSRVHQIIEAIASKA